MKHAPMPLEFNRLAEYNGAKSRGVAYTPRYEREMAFLQHDYNRWWAARLESEGITVIKQPYNWVWFGL